MAVTSDSSSQAGTPPPDPASRRAPADASLGLLKRFLTLREGSIVVVTLITLVYFASTTTNFTSVANFKTLLPYFAPIAILAAGEVFVMILGEIDLSIGAMYLLSPFLFYEIHNGGIPLVPAVILTLAAAMVLGAVNGIAVA